MAASRFNRDLWVSRYQAVHGARYDYSKFIKNGETIQCIAICDKHGDFEFHLTGHAKGTVCPGCKNDAINQEYARRNTAKLKALHGDQFVPNQDDLLERKAPMRFTCKDHGEFTAYVNNLIKSSSKPCVWCIGERKRQRVGSEMIQRFRKAHGDRYDYSEVKYLGAEVKVTVICPDHGKFKILPGNHYANKVGCSKCKAGRPSNDEKFWIAQIEKALNCKSDTQVAIPSGNRNPFLADAVFGLAIVEYDGSYWHSLPKAKDQDERKNEAAIAAGYSVIRLRARDKQRTLPDLSGSCNIDVDYNPTDEETARVVTLVTKKIKEINNERIC